MKKKYNHYKLQSLSDESIHQNYICKLKTVVKVLWINKMAYIVSVNSKLSLFRSYTPGC